MPAALLHVPGADDNHARLPAPRQACAQLLFELAPAILRCGSIARLRDKKLSDAARRQANENGEILRFERAPGYWHGGRTLGGIAWRPRGPGLRPRAAGASVTSATGSAAIGT